MFNKSIFISSLITICLCIIPHCFANNSKNLDELITYAMANNILVKNANSKVEIAKQELIIAKSEYLPELNLKSWGYDDQNYGTNIGLKQNIYDAGKTDNKVEIATLELQYQQQQLNLVKNNLKQNIIQNYLDCQKYYELEYSYKQIRNQKE